MRKHCLACFLRRLAQGPEVLCLRCAHELATYVVFTQWDPVLEAESLVGGSEDDLPHAANRIVRG